MSKQLFTVVLLLVAIGLMAFCAPPPDYPRYELERGKRGITPKSAILIGALTGTSAELWMNLQARYDLWHAMQEMGTPKVKAIACASRRNAPEYATIGKMTKNDSARCPDCGRPLKSVPRMRPREGGVASTQGARPHRTESAQGWRCSACGYRRREQPAGTG